MQGYEAQVKLLLLWMSCFRMLFLVRDAMAKYACQAHVYKEKKWKSSAVECKNL